MAWNDPGRNRNPWGNRPDRGGADLDEALRNLQRKLGGLFGGGRGAWRRITYLRFGDHRRDEPGDGDSLRQAEFDRDRPRE